MQEAQPTTPERPRRRRRKLLIVPFAVGAAVAAGYAFAAWTSTGSGSGEAKAHVALNSTISPTEPSADLYPGATGTMTVTVSNPNPYPVVVTSFSAGSSAVVNTSCTAGTVTSDTASDGTGLAQADGSTKVIAAEGQADYRLTTHMAGSAHNACQDQVFTLALTADLSSAAS